MPKPVLTKSGEKARKLPRMANDDRKEQKRSHQKGTEEERTVHCAAPMDICHLKNSELEPKFKNTEGRVLLQSDTVRDESGFYALFTEHGSSASQMTAAKAMDVIARLPGCAGQAADAVSACTLVKMQDASALFKKSQSQNVQIFGYVCLGMVARILFQH